MLACILIAELIEGQKAVFLRMPPKALWPAECYNKEMKDPSVAFGARITFATGVGTVTGANFFLETPAGTKMLVDCGLVQGERVALPENNEKFPYDPASIQALFITHAHLDHVGRIPKLVREGFKGPIYSTPQTKALAELVLNDAVSIMAAEAMHEGIAPLYGPEDVQKAFPIWKTIEYHRPFKLGDDISITLKDAGHILGSAMIEVTIKEAGSRKQEVGSVENVDNKNERCFFLPASSSLLRVLFTGDLGNSPAPLLRDTEPVGDVDFLVMESTYGDRNHEPKEERVSKLETIIKDTIGRGGTLVIPTFAIDRTQVLLYELNDLVEKGRIPKVPVFVDSPMAIKATEIYKENESLFNDSVRAQIKAGDDIFSFPHLQYTMTQGQSRDIDHIKGAKIILAGSGMSIGGRVISHEEHYLPDPRSTILLVGYQTPGSLGRELADGNKKIRIHGEKVEVKAHVEALYGFSAHKDSDHLVQFVGTATDRLKEVFVVMGEPGASMHLAQRLNDELNIKALMPERLKPYEL